MADPVSLVLDPRGTVHRSTCPLVVGAPDLTPFAKLEATLVDETRWCKCLLATVLRAAAWRLDPGCGETPEAPFTTHMRHLAVSLDERLRQLALQRHEAGDDVAECQQPPHRRAARLPLVREDSTGILHRRDCLRVDGPASEVTGLEGIAPENWGNCVASFVCEQLSTYFASCGPFAPELEHDREVLHHWLAIIAESFENAFRVHGAIRQPGLNLTVVKGDGG